MEKLARICIDPSDVEKALIGIEELSAGICNEIYGRRAEAIREDADGFVANYYELTAGAFDLIAAVTSIITRATVDGDLAIVPAKRGEEEQAG